MPCSRKRDAAGSTLIEVMVALIILTVLVLGVAAFIYYGRASVYAQRDRLAVLEIVTARLEQLRAEPYTTFSDVLPEDYAERWLRLSGGTWLIYNTRRTQNRLVNRSRRYRITTTVQYVDADGGSSSYDMLKFTVGMRYRVGAADEIELTTYRAP
jgi:Tfp pilus assembly protein PilV